MANEKRLIDANALFAEAERIFCVNCYWYDGKCRECQYAEFADMLVDAPTVDAVEVVHCRECVYAKNNYLVDGLCLCEKPIHDVVKGEVPRNTLMTEDDFCSYGERKDNG